LFLIFVWFVLPTQNEPNIFNVYFIFCVYFYFITHKVYYCNSYNLRFRSSLPLLAFYTMVAPIKYVSAEGENKGEIIDKDNVNTVFLTPSHVCVFCGIVKVLEFQLEHHALAIEGEASSNEKIFLQDYYVPMGGVDDDPPTDWFGQYSHRSCRFNFAWQEWEKTNPKFAESNKENVE
jgi:hypothetical protein